MLNKKGQSGIAHLYLILAVVLIAVGFVGWKVLHHTGATLPTKNSAGQAVSYNQAESKALANGNCSGAGSVNIAAPMPVDQIGFVIPYGEVVGGHVTPIDHQYYWGTSTTALRDTYEVLAPASGKIVNIGHRGSKVNTPPHTLDVPSSDEYRLVMAHTCSFFTYVDLVTSLSAQVKSHLPAGWNPAAGDSPVNVPITKGEVIGYIGGQTLDFAVWDLSKPLPGFISYADYNAENWKPYTAPPTTYMGAATRSALITKYLRTTAPIDGKIDYDIDGKLVGNWFQVGTGGYHAQSNTRQDYWNGHLSIAPDNLDPSVYIASIGNYGSYAEAQTKNNDPTQANNNAAQFMISNATPDPATVGTSSGMVKYELFLKTYTLPDGTRWNSSSFATGMKATPESGLQATALAQLTAKRTLKFEVFPGKTAAQVSGFDANATTYTR